MIDKIAAKNCFSLLKWLPAVAAAAFVVALAPKAALAQSTPSTIGYVVKGCGITTDNGTFNYIGLDGDGNPYYENAAGTYLYAQYDDQDNDDFWRWYLGTRYEMIDGLFNGNKGDDYESTWAGAGAYVSFGPAIAYNLLWGDDIANDDCPTSVVSE